MPWWDRLRLCSSRWHGARQGGPEALIGAVWLVDVALAVSWMLFFKLFPDGHRPIQRWRTLVLGSALVLTSVSVVAWLSSPEGAALPVPGHLPGTVSAVEGGGLHAAASQTASVLVGVLPLAAAVCLLLRYPRSGPLVRQQIRVGAAGLSAGVLLEVALLWTLPGVEAGKVHFAVALVAVAVGAFGVAAALLRWRLWVVDQALPRAVVLGACSAGFAAAIVLVATIATGGLRREQVQGAVLAAVLVTVLVQGYSRRLEPWVREIVYGKRPGGYAVLVGLADGFGGGRRRCGTGRIADAARRALAVPWAVLWVPTARPGVYRLAAKAGDVEAADVVSLGEEAPRGPSGATAHARRAALWLPGDSAAAAVLSAAAQPWAVLVVGQRRGDPLTDGDLELLTVICREAELAHDNRVLLGEVAASLEELRDRAHELQVSRQRLVAAQDEERRRIERDLHDGAQHELIALA